MLLNFLVLLFVAEVLSGFLSLQCGLEFWSLGFICSEGLKHPLSSPPHPCFLFFAFLFPGFSLIFALSPAPSPKPRRWLRKQHTQFSEKQGPWLALWTRVANSHKNCFCFLTPIAVGAERVGSSTIECWKELQAKGPASLIWHFLLLKKLLIVG